MPQDDPPMDEQMPPEEPPEGPVEGPADEPASAESEEAAQTPKDRSMDLDELTATSAPNSTSEPEDDYGFDEEIDIPDKPSSAADLETLFDIPVELAAVLGKSTMNVDELLKLGRGAVVEIDRKVGEAIDIYVNNRLVARGEVVVVDDQLGITMTEIIKTGRK